MRETIAEELEQSVLMKDGKKGGKKPSWGEEGRDNNAGSKTQKRKQKTESKVEKTRGNLAGTGNHSEEGLLPEKQIPMS